MKDGGMGCFRLVPGFVGIIMVLVTGAASAMGRVDIAHADGTMSSYPGTQVSIVGETLHLRSPDKRGTLIIERAACSHQGEIVMCLPTKVAIRQHGATRPLPLETGTVYVNTSDGPQRMRHTSRELPPHGILMSLRTQRGTLINLDGTIDSGLRP